MSNLLKLILYLMLALALEQAMRQYHYTLVAGIGVDQLTNPEPGSPAEPAGELLAFSDQAGWSGMLLVTCSFGGFIARAQVSRHPDKVRALLFLNLAHEDWQRSRDAEACAIHTYACAEIGE